MVRLIAGLVMAVALAGCATTTNLLSDREIASLRLESIDIKFAPTAGIWWGKAEREYAEKVIVARGPQPAKVRKASFVENDEGGIESGHNEYAEIMATPEAKLHLRERLAAEIKTKLDARLASLTGGTRPVRV